MLNRFYTGCTQQPEIRLHQHLTGYFDNAFTTKANDWTLQLLLPCQNEGQAKSVEKHIKKMRSSTYIRNLIRFPEMQEKLLEKFENSASDR